MRWTNGDAVLTLPETCKIAGKGPYLVEDQEQTIISQAS